MMCGMTMTAGVLHVRSNLMWWSWGTILTKTEIPMTEGGSYYPREDMNYLGETLTVEEYMRLDMQENKVKAECRWKCKRGTYFINKAGVSFKMPKRKEGADQ